MKYYSQMLIMVVLMALTFNAVSMAQTWVTANSVYSEAAPEVTLLESNNTYVIFRIFTPGVWTRQVTGTDSDVYEVLSLMLDQKVGTEGYPMLPCVTVNLAVPDGTDPTVTVTELNSVTLYNHDVAPWPEVDIDYNDEGMVVVTETFTPNTTIYSGGSLYPSQNYTELAGGNFRTQPIVKLVFLPIRFYPSTEAIEIADSMEVRVDFTSGVGDAVVDQGIFNTAVSMVALNADLPDYNVVPDPNDPGTVTYPDADDWATDWDSHSCDVLVVIPEQLTEDPDFEDVVDDYVNFRASLTGFDISVVTLGESENANDGFLDPIIVGNPIQQPYLGWGYQDPAFMSIRNFTKGLWENGVADHTGDGKLGFLLLCGDARDDENIVPTEHDWLIPSPRPWPTNYTQANGGDCWYGCLNGENPLDQDGFMNIPVGRLPVGSTEEMENVYQKTLTYCTQEDISYRDELLEICGRTFNDHSVWDESRFEIDPGVWVRHCDCAYPIDFFRNIQISLFRQGCEIWQDAGGTVTYDYAHHGPNESGQDPAGNQWQNWQTFADVNQPLSILQGYGEDGDKAIITGQLNDGVGIVVFYGHGEPNRALGFCSAPKNCTTF